jgi:hypothetical protein
MIQTHLFMCTNTTWKQEKVKSREDILHFSQYRQTSLPEIITDVELSKIVGTTYEDYNKGTWEQMMKSLKPRREKEVFPSERYFKMVHDNHDHSQGSGLFQQAITLAKYGEEYIIFDGGNHRIFHAKFAGIQTLRLRVQEYIIDPTLKKTEVEALHPTKEIPECMSLVDRVFDRIFKSLGV